MHEFGSLEESLSMWAIEQEGETEYLKILCIINAIMTAGNSIRGAISQMAGGQADPPSGKELENALKALEEKLLPGRKGNLDEKAKKYRKILLDEHKKGELKVKSMKADTSANRVRRFNKVK
jgi:hypothetical protein